MVCNVFILDFQTTRKLFHEYIGPHHQHRKALSVLFVTKMASIGLKAQLKSNLSGDSEGPNFFSMSYKSVTNIRLLVTDANTNTNTKKKAIENTSTIPGSLNKIYGESKNF